MKKKNYFYLAALSLAMTFSMGACSDNNDPNPDGGGKDPVNLDYSSENASAWGNYMYNVAMLLNDDATIATLLGHASLSSVSHYRQMSPQTLADKTKPVIDRRNDKINQFKKGWMA